MKPVVQISCLGSLGRFGNQLFQYCYARRYAEKVGAILQTPGWLGQRLFEIDDPPIQEKLPELPLDQLPRGEVNVNLNGYFQGLECLSSWDFAWARGVLKFRDSWRQQLDSTPAVGVCLHLRIHTPGSPWTKITEPAALQAMAELGRLPDRVVSGGGYDQPCEEAMADFMVMMKSGELFRGNSTFGWWAGVLGGGRVFSPVVLNGRLHYVDGNGPLFVAPFGIPSLENLRV